jgi:hypothetical protein
MTEWSEPVMDLDGDWVDSCIKQFAWLVLLISPLRGDALVERQWKAALEVLDLEPGPTTVEQANERWREFVAQVWHLVLSAGERRRYMIAHVLDQRLRHAVQ